MLTWVHHPYELDAWSERCGYIDDRLRVMGDYVGRIRIVGCVVALILFSMMVAGLEARLLDSALDTSLSTLRSVWVYVLLLLLAFAGWVSYGRMREQSRFGEVRLCILDLMRTYGLSKHELLARAQRPRMPGHAADLTRYLAEADLEANA